MEDNTTVTVMDTEMSAYNEAIKLHNEIIANGTIAANALYDMCVGLKRMRDDKLYTQLGYDDFDNYCEDKANIKRRQAHNYIRSLESLGKSFLQSNANIGITKLELLTHLPAPDRAEFARDNDLQSISVAELQAKIDELQRDNGQKAEQLSLLTEQVKGDVDKQALIDGLTRELNILRKKPVDVAVAQPDPKVIEAEIKKVRDEESKKAERLRRDIEDKAKLAEQEFKKELESNKQYIAKLEQAAASAAKPAAVSGDGATRFKVYFEQANDIAGKMADALDEIEDEAIKSKYRRKMSDLADMILDASGYLSGDDDD